MLSSLEWENNIDIKFTFNFQKNKYEKNDIETKLNGEKLANNLNNHIFKLLKDDYISRDNSTIFTSTPWQLTLSVHDYMLCLAILVHILELAALQTQQQLLRIYCGKSHGAGFQNFSKNFKFPKF